MSYLGPKILDIVPSELKKAQSYNSFKKSIRKWAPDNCPFRLCKRYVNGVGFMFTANVFTRMAENHYNFWHRSDFIVPFARTVYHGTESISYLAPKIWDILNGVGFM